MFYYPIISSEKIQWLIDKGHIWQEFVKICPVRTPNISDSINAVKFARTVYEVQFFLYEIIKKLLLGNTKFTFDISFWKNVVYIVTMIIFWNLSSRICLKFNIIYANIYFTQTVLAVVPIFCLKLC